MTEEPSTTASIRRSLGIVRLRQIADRVRHRLSFVPMLYVVAAIVVVQTLLLIDRSLNDQQVPEWLQTTVDSARSVFSAIAGGLITSITLLLSLMMVAIQLAGSQFSPRTLRNWTGDRTQQLAIGLVLGTVVYCLLILRETRTFSEGDALTPHTSTIVAVVLGIASLIAVVRSVDHLTDRLRVGSVAGSILDETLEAIEKSERLAMENPIVAPAGRPTEAEREIAVPDDAVAVTAPRSGWIQQIDTATVIEAVPEGTTVYLPSAIGSFAVPDAPMAWVWPPLEEPGGLDAVRAAFALGDTRTMQQDIGFGILQMVDIALRALSPGVNDPNTANDMVMHLGVVLLRLWERPMASNRQERDGRTLMTSELDRADYLHVAFDPLRVHGVADPSVASTIVRVLATLRAETVRRELPGPTEPIDDVIVLVMEAVEQTALSEFDKRSIRALCPRPGRSGGAANGSNV